MERLPIKYAEFFGAVSVNGTKLLSALTLTTTVHSGVQPKHGKIRMELDNLGLHVWVDEQYTIVGPANLKSTEVDLAHG